MVQATLPADAPPSRLQTYADNAQRTNVYADPSFLKHAEPLLLIQRYFQSRPLPRNKAETISFRRFLPWGIQTSKIPIAEGVTPQAHGLESEDVLATMQQYADIFQMTDRTKYLSEDNIWAEAMKLSGEQAAETFETVDYEVAVSGSNVFYDTGAHASRAVVDSPITLSRLQAASRSLQQQRAKMITEELSPSLKISTRGVERGWVVLGSTDLESDIRALPGFKETVGYGTPGRMNPFEIGSVERFRFCLSPVFVPFLAAGAVVGSTEMTSAAGVNVDVYPLIVLGKDALGGVPLRGKDSVSHYVCPVDKIDKSDLLGQRGYISWVAWRISLILNQLWMARIEVGASNLANA